MNSRPVSAPPRDASRWVGLLLSAVLPLGAVIYGVSYEIYRPSYQVFGLRPEDVGLTYGRLVSQAGTLVGILIALFGGYLLFGLMQYRLVKETAKPLPGMPWRQPRSWLSYTAVVVTPVVAVVLAPTLAPRGVPQEVTRTVLLASAVLVWVVAGGRGRPRRVLVATISGGAMAFIGAFSQVTTPPRVTTAVQLVMVWGLATAIALAYEHPMRERASVVAMRLVPFGGLVCLLALTSGTINTWLAAASAPLIFGWYLAVVFPASDAVGALDRVVRGWRSIVAFAAVAFSVIVTLAWVTDRQTTAVDEARLIKAGRPLRPNSFRIFPIHADLARVIPRTGDPLKLCTSNRVVRLLGRSGDTWYILLRPPTAGDPAEGKVVPLPFSDYLVATGFDTPGLCEPSP